ncbi:MAG: N-acetylmuramoyl-L-alanine amidase [Cyanobacteria bacterium J06638_20]
MRAIALSVTASITVGMIAVARAESPLMVVYPPENHETIAEQIFLIGTAAPDASVTVNGEPLENRSPAGHFAPSFPLQMGENRFVVQQGEETLEFLVTRVSPLPPLPNGVAFAEGTLTPDRDISRLPDDLLCFRAIAPQDSSVSVRLSDRTLPLLPQPNGVELPPNYAVLTNQNEPIPVSEAQRYEGCAIARQFLPAEAPTESSLDLGIPEFWLQQGSDTVRQAGAGSISILSSQQPQIVEVTAASGTARTGPSTSYSRLTPLPTGTRAAVTGREANWYRLDYGAWIRDTDVQEVAGSVPPHTLIRSVTSRVVDGWTEVRFPLQAPIPVSVLQEGDRFTLTLHNATAQTDTIYLSDDPVIQRLDWTQPAPDRVEYRFALKSDQQWGYKLHYEGTTLVLSLRHPPQVDLGSDRPLDGITILVDPGHGGPEDLGARGPNGVPEKDVNLVVSRLLRDRLEARGATVIMTRDDDIDLWPNDRADMIQNLEPTLALSIHYNALPDNGDAENTAGIGMFWYHAQAHSLAVFLHNYLVEERDRPSYGIFWNNLALTRPNVAPSVLLELGFMINPTEFEWIVDPDEQAALAESLAEGVTQWLGEATQ